MRLYNASFNSITGSKLRTASSNPFEDPVLPIILSGLTMNFMLYQKDYGLDRKVLLSFQPSNESCESSL